MFTSLSISTMLPALSNLGSELDNVQARQSICIGVISRLSVDDVVINRSPSLSVPITAVAVGELFSGLNMASRRLWPVMSWKWRPLKYWGDFLTPNNAGMAVVLRGWLPHYDWQCLLIHLIVIIVCCGQRFEGETNWFLSAIWSTLSNDSPNTVRRCIGCQSNWSSWIVMK